MKLKLSIFLGINLLFIGKVFSQNYDLNTFTNRYQKYRGLVLDYNFDASQTSSFQNRKDIYGYQNNSNNLYTGSLSVQYFSYVNNNHKSTTENFYVSASGGKKTATFLEPIGNRINTSEIGQKESISYSRINIKYFKKMFLEYHINENFDFSGRNGKNKNSLNQSNFYTNSVQLQNKAGILIGGGLGRINNITNYVTADFLLREMIKQGLIENYNNEQLENIGRVIVEINNKRYIGDERFKYIDQISTLDSACKANNVKGKSELKHFSVLYDNLLFYAPLQRNNGHKFTNLIGFSNSIYNLKNTNDTSIQKSRSNLNNVSFSSQFEYYHQINVFSQIAFKTNFYWDHSNNNKKWFQNFNNYDNLNYNFHINEVTNNLLSSFSLEHLIQLNSRTYLNSYLYYSMNFNKNISENTKFASNYIKLYSSFRYFISRKTSVFLDLTFGYYNSKFYKVFDLNKQLYNYKSNHRDLNFKSGISHSIF